MPEGALQTVAASPRCGQDHPTMRIQLHDLLQKLEITWATLPARTRQKACKQMSVLRGGNASMGVPSPGL